MKILRYIVAVGIGACLLSGGSVYAQRSVATYSKEAMENLVPLLAKAANDQFTMEPSTAPCWIRSPTSTDEINSPPVFTRTQREL